MSTGEDEDCFNLYSVQLIPLSAADSSTLQGPFIPAVTVASGSENNQRTLSFNIDSGINPNEIYSVTIITVSVNGERNSTGDITFSEFDCIYDKHSCISGREECWKVIPFTSWLVEFDHSDCNGYLVTLG